MRERTSVQHTTSTAPLCPTTLSSDSPVRLLIVFNYIISIDFLYSNGLSSNYSMISYFLQFSKYGAVKDKLLVSFCKVHLGTYLQNKRKTLIPRSQHPQNAQSQHFCKYELMWSILLWSYRKPAVPLFDLCDSQGPPCGRRREMRPSWCRWGSPWCCSADPLQGCPLLSSSGWITVSHLHVYMSAHMVQGHKNFTFKGTMPKDWTLYIRMHYIGFTDPLKRERCFFFSLL